MFTLQEHLASATRPLHQRIENNPFMDALRRQDSLILPYQWLLARLYIFSSGAESKLITLIPETEGWEIPKRCRTDLICDDLCALGIIPEVPQASLFDAIDTLPKAIGLLYVLEGSRKGGEFLSALLQTKEPLLPIRYLLGYGESTDSEWNHFCTLLERYADTPFQDDILSGALIAFTVLERIFHDHA